MKAFIKILQLSFLLVSLTTAQNTTNVFKNGVVVSASQLASEVGIEIMKSGGNAIDAAVATGFALAVTFPQAGNIGGGGFLVAHLADGKNITIDFRETAPLAAHRDMFLDENGEVIKDMSLRSHRAVGVPGSVAGLLTAWRHYGSGNVSLKQLLKASISLAKNGFPISERFAQSLNNSQNLFQKDDGASEVFIRSDRKHWQTNDFLIQKDLAKTLQRIAKYDLDGFYSGKTAELIVKEMKEGNGLITLKDLDSYSPKLRAPIIGTYKNYKIISMGPPSSGGILLVQMLNMLESFVLDTLDFDSADYIHLLTEIERRAYADRAEHIGDSDYWAVPIEMLTSKNYARERIQNISMRKAIQSTEVFAGEPSAYESRETTHYSVIDKDGNAVSVTTTLNTGFGAGILVEGAGFLLNNEMDDFSAKPGSPGGSTIITTVLQVVLNIIEHEMDIYEAVAAPRVHSQWLPDVIITEPDAISNSVRKELESRGHKIIPYKLGYIGSANGILINEDRYYGAPDPRNENSAVGY